MGVVEPTVDESACGFLLACNGENDSSGRGCPLKVDIGPPDAVHYFIHDSGEVEIDLCHSWGAGHFGQ